MGCEVGRPGGRRDALDPTGRGDREHDRQGRDDRARGEGEDLVGVCGAAAVHRQHAAQVVLPAAGRAQLDPPQVGARHHHCVELLRIL